MKPRTVLNITDCGLRVLCFTNYVISEVALVSTDIISEVALVSVEHSNAWSDSEGVQWLREGLFIFGWLLKDFF